MFFFDGYGDPRDLHVLPHSFPTRRSSDLRSRCRCCTTSPSSVSRCSSTAGPSTSCSSQCPCRGWSCNAPVGVSSCEPAARTRRPLRSEEHTSELQSLMLISYAAFCLQKTILFYLLISSLFYYTSIIS